MEGSRGWGYVGRGPEDQVAVMDGKVMLMHDCIIKMMIVAKDMHYEGG